MPEKTSLSLNGIGLTSPNRDVVTGTAKNGTTDTAPNGVERFIRTVTLTSGAAALTPVTILADAEVGTGRKVYVTDVFAAVAGTTAWAASGGTLTGIVVRDKNSSPVEFVTWATADLTNNARLWRQSTNVSVKDPWVEMSGGTSAKGLELVAYGSSPTGITGDSIILTVEGYIG
jgi:hypothetical protein